MKNFRILIGFCFLGLFPMLNSCKKNDILQQTSSSLQTKEQLLANLKEDVLKNPALKRVIFPINEKAEGYFADLQGNQINTLDYNPAARTYECASPEDLTNPPIPTLISLGEDYDCNLGYKFTFTWHISISVNLVNQLGSLMSRGRFRLRSSSNSLIYQDLNITPLTITDIGDDPATLNQNTLYEIVYTTDWVAQGYLGSVYSPSIETGLVVYTDCVDLPSYVTPYQTYAFDGENACSRIDPISIVSVDGVTTTNGILMGFGYFLWFETCPYPSSYADRQEIQLKYVGPGGDDAQWQTISPQQGSGIGYLDPFTDGTGGTIDQRGTIGSLDMYYIPERDLYNNGSTIMHGDYLVRYRNVMYPLSSGCKGPWSREMPATF